MDMRERLHYLFRAVITGGFSLYTIYLAKEDKLIYYIAPRMEPIVKLSAIALSILAVYLVFNAVWPFKHAGTDCGCRHVPGKSPIRNTIAYTLLISPLLLGWFTPDTIMGSNVVDVKGIVLSNSSKPAEESVSDRMDEQTSPSDLVTDPETDAGSDQPLTGEEHQSDPFETDGLYDSQYSAFARQLQQQHPIIVQEEAYLETITAIDLFRDAFEGKSIQISGFVYKQEDMSDTQFVVARLAMECCSADSTPYGFLVEWPDAAAIPQDQWVSVSAVISSVNYHGYDIVLLKAENVEFIETPATPYVYPNYEILFE